MKIKQITSQHRRDFYSTYQCEHCGAEETNVAGYDDENFHKNVIPDMVCKQCGNTADSDYRPLAPRYSNGTTI